MSIRKSRFIGAGLAAGAVLVTGAADPVFAATGDQPASVETVVVTGSRLKRDEYTSPDPLQVLTAGDALLKGLPDLASILRSSSIVSGSYQQTTGLANMPISTGGQGTQTVSLRGLNAQRTLVLLNGRRAGPAGVNGTVSAFDLNVLPTSVLERVEILKDGASSVYGSDAVAGVVNIITKTRFEGGTFDAYSTEPFQDGGRQYHVSASYGWNFDRGYFNVAVEHNVQETLRQGQRDYLSCGADLISDASGHSLDIIDNVTGKPKCFELPGGFPGYVNGAWVNGVGYLQYDPTNAYGPYEAATSGNPYFAQGYRRVFINNDPASFAPVQTGGPFFNRRSALLGLTTDTVFAQGGYDISSGVEAYGEFLANRRDSKLHYLATLTFPISAAQPHNPFGALAYPGAVVPSDGTNLVDYTRGVLGFRGTLHDGLLDGWDWDVSATISRSKGTYSGFSILQDAVNYEDGNPGNGECGVAGVTETPISHHACTSVNWFGSNVIGPAPAVFSTAEQAYLFHNSVGHTEYDQDVFEGSLTGTAFNLPAGPVATAIGFMFRDDRIDDAPDPQAQAFNQTFLNANRTKGSDASRELYGEIGIPLLADKTFAENLDVTVSGRFVDYDSYGSNATWKAGASWRPFDWIRFHATEGTSFRAPALFEQFQGNATLIYQQTIGYDPCINWQLNPNATIQTNCAAAGVPMGLGVAGAPSAIETRGGGTNVKPETSRSTTVGFVLTPKFDVADFSLAADYWEITVNNELAFYNSNQVGLCYASTSYPTDPLCSLFHRNPTTHYVDTIDDHFVNISSQRERGIDVSAQVHRDLGFVDLTANTQWTFKLADNSTLFSGAAPTNRLDRVGYPAITGNANFRFTRDEWTFNWAIDFLGRASDNKYIATSSTTNAHVPVGTTVYYKDFTEAVMYHTVSLTWSMDRWTAELGIANLFDTHPPELSSNESSRRGVSALPNYDLIGRRAFADLKIAF